MDERRRLSFGSVADLYDHARPSYPVALVDDVVEYAAAGGARSDRAVEVGAGTGKATALFAARGLNVVAIEPSAEMAQIARRNLAGYDNVTVEQTEFERWRPSGHEYGLLFSGQAWHWIAPDVRYVAARAALEDGGALAAFWNVPDWSLCDLRESLGDVYRRHGRGGDTDDPLNPASRSGEGDWATEIAAHPVSAPPRRAATRGTPNTRPPIFRPARRSLRMSDPRPARAGWAPVRHRRHD